MALYYMLYTISLVLHVHDNNYNINNADNRI